MAGYADGTIGAINERLEVAFVLTDDLTKDTCSTGMKHRPVSRNYPITNTFMCTCPCHPFSHKENPNFLHYSRFQRPDKMLELQFQGMHMDDRRKTSYRRNRISS